MPDSDSNPLAVALAGTYSPAGASSGWERVAEYHRVRDYTAAHPEQGSSAVANALDLPRGRMRSWVDGDGRPDPVRAIEVAEQHDWLTQNWDRPVAHGLNVLVAWVFSGGSISTESYRPYFTVQDTLSGGILDTAFTHVGVSYRIERTESEIRGTQATPSEYATVLGRTLVAWGAPTGVKHRERPLSLPSYLWDAPEDVRLDFARTYLLNRGVARQDNTALPIQFREERPPEYRSEVLALFKRLVDDPDAVTQMGDAMGYLKPEAANQLYLPPTFGQDSPAAVDHGP